MIERFSLDCKYTSQPKGVVKPKPKPKPIPFDSQVKTALYLLLLTTWCFTALQIELARKPETEIRPI